MRHPRAGLASAALQAHITTFDAAFFAGTAPWEALKAHLAFTARLAAHVLARQHGRLGTRHRVALACAITLIEVDDLMAARLQVLAALQAMRP